MAEAMQCDRCSTFETTGAASLRDLRVTFGPAPEIPGDAHLCKDCKESFRRWWKAGDP